MRRRIRSRRFNVRMKQKPEDFSVKESYRFNRVPSGKFRVYLLEKQKVSTYEAVGRIERLFGLKPGAVSYCGLKDKQGWTEQLIGVEGADVTLQDPDLRLKFLGRTDEPISAANATSNRFAVTVRSLTSPELRELPIAADEVQRLGILNYFDDQRFGSLKHGQGFIAKDLLRGDFEAALRNFFAVPSDLDRTGDAKVKAFWRDHWGDWRAHCQLPEAKKYSRLLYRLKQDPNDFLGALLSIESRYRAMLLFTYQSYLWNETARRLLQLCLPRESLFPMRYQAGTLLHHRSAPPEVLHFLRKATVPLLAPDTTFTDARVAEAANWVLGKEKLTLDKLVVPGAERRLFFKHEERPLLVFPYKLIVGKPRPDELNRGYTKVNVAFTLPLGSYATMVIKRLFAAVEESRPARVEEHQPLPRKRDPRERRPARPDNAPRRRPPMGRKSAGPQ